MVGARVVEVYGSLYQSQTEEVGVEIEIPLRITRNRGNVMNPMQLHLAIDACICGKG